MKLKENGGYNNSLYKWDCRMGEKNHLEIVNVFWTDSNRDWGRTWNRLAAK